MPVSKDLLDILVCPQCKGDLLAQGDTALDCPKCKLRYPIVDDIPVMLVDEAKKL
jgi:uncharacterized protein YbaR (Trm112 family)